MTSCPSTPNKKSRHPVITVSSPYFTKQIEVSVDSLFQQLGSLKPLLIQERVANDPWKLLVAVTLLNKTTAKVAIPAFWELITRWPTPWALSKADAKELLDFLRPLGTYSIRSKRLIALSKAYLLDPPSAFDARPSKPVIASPSKKSPSKKTNGNVDLPSTLTKRLRYPATPISHLPGTGSYALDSYRIFCSLHEDPFSEEWKSVTPTDKELVLYLRWRWAHLERLEWSAETGETRSVRVAYLTELIQGLKEFRERSQSG